MDINQRLLRKKIAKKVPPQWKAALEEKVQCDAAHRKDLEAPVEDDPMMQKKLEFYKKVFDPESHIEEEDEEYSGVPKDKKKHQKKDNNKNNDQEGKDKLHGKQGQSQIPELNEKSKAKPKYNRKKQYELHTAKTRKGQPLMKNVINNLLNKIQKSMKWDIVKGESTG